MMPLILDTLHPLHGRYNYGRLQQVEYTEVPVSVEAAKAHLNLVPEAVVVISPTDAGRNFVTISAWQALDKAAQGRSLYLGVKRGR